MVIAQSLSDVGKMLRDLEAEASKYGLKINADKTKVLQLDPRSIGVDRVRLAESWVQVG